MDMEYLDLDAACLASKYGFLDGDAVGYLLEHHDADELLRRCDALDNDTFRGEHLVLIAAVRTRLLPLVPGVETYRIVSIHNPIRATPETCHLCPQPGAVSVRLSLADVEAIIAKLEAAE